MLDKSNKQNEVCERQDPRLVTFHFCERYTKKGDRRLKTEMPSSQPRIIKGSKILLVAKAKRPIQPSKTQQKNKHKFSNFEILKRKISYLETEQFLGDISHRNELKDIDCNPQTDYVINNEFAYQKRISVLEKYRQNIKNIRKQNEKRKASLNLIIKTQPGDSYSKLALQFAPPTPFEVEPSDWLVRKRQLVTQCAKRYYRPQSFNRSKEGKLIDNVAEVKGTKVEHTGRAHKSTTNFY